MFGESRNISQETSLQDLQILSTGELFYMFLKRFETRNKSGPIQTLVLVCPGGLCQ